MPDRVAPIRVTSTTGVTIIVFESVGKKRSSENWMYVKTTNVAFGLIVMSAAVSEKKIEAFRLEKESIAVKFEACGVLNRDALIMVVWISR